ncbi:MAG: YggS family pyridoxal phosphate-dependent enzyme [Candidatus Poribacteria bacterium]|nr:YggS family pyridoxal phosphate-dependent enzyme [Candidatus Poribacteria bacterium]
MASIQENLSRLQDRIAKAAERSGHDPHSICLVAVSKTKPASLILEAIDAGVTDIGENRVQEAQSKWNQIDRSVRWHLVGHLQRNKVKQALAIFDLIHSVDSLRLLAEIDRRSAQLNRRTDVLIQVNTSGEPSKHGIEPDQTLDLIESGLEYEHVRINGLMTIGAFLPDPEAVRPSFVLLQQLREKIVGQQFPEVDMEYLSMGMTNDFEVAIEEGANLVRVGTAIFGARE